MDDKNLKKLEEMKSKVGSNANLKTNDTDIESLIRNILKEELELFQGRIYNGLSKIIFSGRDEVKGVDAKVNKLLKMAEVDSKQDEILEIWDKINKLTKGSV